MDYDNAADNGAEESKEGINKNDDISESRKLVLLDRNNNPNDVTLAFKRILKINGDDEKRDQFYMKIESPSNNHKNRSKKKQVQHANRLQKNQFTLNIISKKTALKEKIRMNFLS